MQPEAKTMWENFKGRENVSLNAARARCGFSTHEAMVALEVLRKAGLAMGRFEWGGTASFAAREQHPAEGQK